MENRTEDSAKDVEIFAGGVHSRGPDLEEQMHACKDSRPERVQRDR
jgi:hypothetical protein